VREYEAVARVVAQTRGWEIAGISLAPDRVSGGWRVRLAGAVGATEAENPNAAYVVSEWSLGGVLATPTVMSAVLLTWPAGTRCLRFMRGALGLVGLVLLEVFGIGLALLGPFADADAVLHSRATPTMLQGWSRILEAGGHLALALVAALIIVALTRTQGALRAERQQTGEGSVGPQR